MSEIYTDPPQSRNEAIIKATIDGTEYTAPPQSRMEDLLLELKEVIEQGGGGGTKDYEALDNKPSVNDVTLIGNKTSADLGLMPEYEVDTTPTESSENLITSGGVWSADKNINDKLQGAKIVSGNPLTVTDAEPMNAESVVVELEPKQDLHGYSKPWAGGAGKNKLPLVLSDIKTFNTEGTWSGNSYSVYGVTFEVLTDSADNVTEIVVNGTSTRAFNFSFTDKVEGMSGLKYNGAGAGTTNNKCLIVGYWNTSTEFVTDGRVYGGNDYTLLDYPYMSFGIFIQNAQTLTNESFYPMLRLSTETATDFEPYSNICPISGYSEVNVENNTDTYTIDLDGTKYGGTLDVTNGVLKITDGYIASYNGETLPSTWISSMDEYAEGTTPTTGAEVVYTLATPLTIQLTPTQIQMLENTNNISTDGTNITLKYQPNNVIGECKAYTDKKCSEVLPQPPTTDGTYHLECSVSSGNPTITWVLNS